MHKKEASIKVHTIPSVTEYKRQFYVKVREIIRVNICIYTVKSNRYIPFCLKQPLPVIISILEIPNTGRTEETMASIYGAIMDV